MATLKTFSSFTTTPASSDFPALQALFHADDVSNGATAWPSRVGNLIANLSGQVLKDSAGVYASADRTVSSVTGTMPTPANYMVLVAIGTTKTGSATAGLVTTFGDGVTSSMSNVGTFYDNTGTDQGNQASLSGNPATTGKPSVKLAYFDCVNTTPAILQVLANNVGGTQAIGSATDSGVTGIALLKPQLSSALTLPGLLGTTAAGSRGKIVALFSFSTALTMNELKLAANEMARTQQLYAGWRNRV